MNITPKTIAIFLCAAFAVSGCKYRQNGGIYSEVLDAIESHCNAHYPCLMNFNTLPAEWQTLTVFPYGASESPVKVGPGAYIDTRVEFCDRYMVVTRTGSRILENRDKDIETMPDRELTFIDSPGLRYTQLKRGDVLLITLEPSSSGGHYYSIASKSGGGAVE